MNLCKTFGMPFLKKKNCFENELKKTEKKFSVFMTKHDYQKILTTIFFGINSLVFYSPYFKFRFNLFL